MANSVEKIIGKFTSVVQELEDHQKKQWNLAALHAKVIKLINKIEGFFIFKMNTLMSESTKAGQEAARLRKLLSGE